MNKIRMLQQTYHPIVLSLLVGTIFSRAATSMSLPFLAIYLSLHTSMSASMIGFVIGMGPLAGAIGGFIGGTLSDRIGRRVIMMSALYVWGFVFIGFALATSPIVFLLLNILNGLCRSFFEPVSQALMADMTEPEKRFRVFSHRYLAINIGVAVGPLLGAYFGLISAVLPFMITGFVYLLYAITLRYLLKRFEVRKIEGQKKETKTFRSALGVIRRDVTFRFYIIGGIIGAIGYSQMTVNLSQYIERTVTSGVTLFAWLMTINALSVVVFQLPITRLVEKRAPLTVIMIGGVMYAMGDVGFALSSGWIGFIVSMIIFTFGEILTFPSMNLLIDRLAPEGMRGTYFGAQSFNTFGAFLGPWIGGIILSVYGGTVLFTLMAVVSIIGSSIYWLGKKLQERRSLILTEMHTPVDESAQ